MLLDGTRKQPSESSMIGDDAHEGRSPLDDIVAVSLPL